MRRVLTAILGTALLAGAGVVPAGAQARPSAAPETVELDSAASAALLETLLEMRNRRERLQLLRGVTLTDAQREQVRAIDGRRLTRLAALRAELGAAAPDSVRLRRLRELSLQERGELRAVLTAEQRIVFDRNAAQIQKRYEARRRAAAARRAAAGTSGAAGDAPDRKSGRFPGRAGSSAPQQPRTTSP